jgi:hypothetical protein
MLLSSCSDRSAETPLDITAPSYQAVLAEDHGAALHHVNGSGHLFEPQSRRVFTFTAHERTDGSLAGQFSLTVTTPLFGSENPSITHVEAEVVCLVVDGNRAWVGGVVKNASNPDWIGGETAWAVEDNGEGGEAQDFISFMRLPPQHVPGFAQFNCDNRTWTPDRPIDAGNVVVREGASGDGNVRSVTGSGHIWTPGSNRRFTFSARETTDGSGSGQFSLTIDSPLFGSTHPTLTRLEAEVVCVVVDGNQAWVGGVVKNASNPEWIGSETGWAVEDNGEGHPSPDRISIMRLPPVEWAGFAQFTCDNRVFFPDRPVERGNVTVR